MLTLDGIWCGIWVYIGWPVTPTHHNVLLHQDPAEVSYLATFGIDP